MAVLFVKIGVGVADGDGASPEACLRLVCMWRVLYRRWREHAWERDGGFEKIVIASGQELDKKKFVWYKVGVPAGACWEPLGR